MAIINLRGEILNVTFNLVCFERVEEQLVGIFLILPLSRNWYFNNIRNVVDKPIKVYLNIISSLFFYKINTISD